MFLLDRDDRDHAQFHSRSDLPAHRSADRAAGRSDCMSTIQQSTIVSGLSRKGIAPPSFIGALGVIGAFVLAALLAPLVLGDDPFANHFIPGGGLARYQWPSPAFPFGTNVY